MNDYKKMQVVIVVKSKKKADALSAFLLSKEFNAAAVHGNHRQAQQQDAATRFNLGALHIIITTDMILKTLVPLLSTKANNLNCGKISIKNPK